MGNFDCAHKIGITKGLDKELSDGLLSAFYDECAKIGIYWAISRQADREGFPEISETFIRYANDNAQDAGRLAEMIGGILLTESTKNNIKARIEAEMLECKAKMELSNKIKEAGNEDAYNILMDISKNISKHGESLTKVSSRYFEEKKS